MIRYKVKATAEAARDEGFKDFLGSKLPAYMNDPKDDVSLICPPGVSIQMEDDDDWNSGDIAEIEVMPDPSDAEAQRLTDWQDKLDQRAAAVATKEAALQRAETALAEAAKRFTVDYVRIDGMVFDAVRHAIEPLRPRGIWFGWTIGLLTGVIVGGLLMYYWPALQEWAGLVQAD